MALRRRFRLTLICAAAALLASRMAVADVYVAEDTAGHPVYASHPAGPGFRLLYRDPVAGPAVVTRTPVALPRASAASRAQRERLEPMIVRAAAANSLDPALLRAVIHVESRFNAAAVSPAGAVGAMQLMAGTAKRYGVANRGDARQNVDAGARYLRDLLARFDGNVALALSAYNAGEGAVERHTRRVPPYRETLTYVPEVLARAEGYRDEAAGVRN